MSITKQKQSAVHPSLFSWLPYLMIGLVVLFLAGYVWQINLLATSGYQFRELGKQLSSLRKTRKDLENLVLGFRSIEKLQGQVDQLSFSSANKVEYIDPATNLIAKK